MTPLHLAAIKSEHEIVKYLVDQGTWAQMEALTKDYKTPLDLAVESENCKRNVMKLLVNSLVKRRRIEHE